MSEWGAPQADEQEWALRDAIKEANRCLNCRDATCRKGCPIGNDIPEFIRALAHGDLGEARGVIARKSNLPSICGRVCAHELQCEGHCILAKKERPIRIGRLERSIADFAFEMELPLSKLPQKTRGKIAVIGSGPAGLTVAGDLAKMGFNVTVFEVLDEPGGILLYGIPSFRLSKKIVRREIKSIEMLGVVFRTGCMIGRDMTVDQMFDDGFDAIFIGTGTAVARELNLPGRHLPGIAQSSYLLRMNYLHRSGQLQREEVPVQAGDSVIVIGAGNVGVDAARTAKRLGAGSVSVISRGDKDSITALQSEYDAARAEEIAFLLEHEPLAFNGTDEGLRSMTVQTPGGKLDLEADKVFIAIGSRPANRIVSTTGGIKVDDDGYVVIMDQPYGMTTRKGVFAGGDVVHRPATVVLAMKEAKRVARAIADYTDAVHLLRLIDERSMQI